MPLPNPDQRVQALNRQARRAVQRRRTPRSRFPRWTVWTVWTVLATTAVMFFVAVLSG